MKYPTLNKNTVQFLKNLAQNNDRYWFNTNKESYAAAQHNMVEFAESVISEMNKHDSLVETTGKKSLYRIYNDVRFSKDKSPYNARFAFRMQRATKAKRGGYYVQIKPGSSFLACGFFSPNPEDLKRIRRDIEINYKAWHKLLKSKAFITNFTQIHGEKVNTVPRGFSIDHPAIDLIRQKQFLFRHNFSDKEIQADNFALEIAKIFKSIRPIFDYMSDVLTTDLNGESLI